MNYSKIENQIESLKSSPLFNASLASKELFHSNFLAWIFETRKQESINFFERLNLELDLSPDFTVEREKRNIDITLNFKNSIILIENKVKSIPREDQLKKYNEDILDNKNGKLILLSLFKFKSDNCFFLSYDEIVKWLSEINNKPDNHEDNEEQKLKEYYIISDYIFFVKSLVKLFTGIPDTAESEGSKEIFDFYSQSELYQDFLKIRLHDILHKIKYRDIRIDIENKIKQSIEPIEELFFSASDYFSRATAASNFTIRISPDKKKLKYFEIQFQDDYLRFMLFSENCVPFYEKIMQNENFKWFFEFSELYENNPLYKKPKTRKNFNKYGNYIIYKYIRVEHDVDMESLKSSIYEIILKTVNKLKPDSVRIEMNDFLDNIVKQKTGSLK